MEWLDGFLYLALIALVTALSLGIVERRKKKAEKIGVDVTGVSKREENFLARRRRRR